MITTAPASPLQRTTASPRAGFGSIVTSNSNGDDGSTNLRRDEKQKENGAKTEESMGGIHNASVETGVIGEALCPGHGQKRRSRTRAVIDAATHPHIRAAGS